MLARKNIIRVHAGIFWSCILGQKRCINWYWAIDVLRNVFFWKFDTHPPPRNANNVDPYIFVTFFPGNLTLSHPLLCLFIYLLHLFTQGMPKQFTLIFIGALHTFHIFTNKYVQFKHNTMQSNCSNMTHIKTLHV